MTTNCLGYNYCEGQKPRLERRERHMRKVGGVILIASAIVNAVLSLWQLVVGFPGWLATGGLALFLYVWGESMFGRES